MKVTAKTCTVLIMLFYSVGLFGFLYAPLVPLFQMLVPFHLLLMLALIVISQPEKNTYFWLFLAIVYLAGFLIELAGTQTGLIFGNYFYGPTLGYSLWKTPLIIGVNWILVVYSAGMLLSGLRIKKLVPFLLIGASVVTLLDYIIEPVAVHYDYWFWDPELIPFQNYAIWFLFSGVLLWIFFKMPFKKQNKAASVLFVVQFFFFLILRIWVYKLST